MSNHLQEIIARAKTETLTPADIQALAAAIQSGQFTLATGQQAVAIDGSAAESVILTGSNNQVFVLKGAAAEAFQSTFQQLSSAITSPQPLDNQFNEQAKQSGVKVLATPDLDIQALKSQLVSINSYFESLKFIFKAGGELSEDQNEDLNFLIESVSNIEQQLKTIAKRSQMLFEKLEQSLQEKLRKNNELMKTSIEQSYQSIELKHNKESLERQLEIMRRFMSEMKDGWDASDWLDQNIKQFARAAGKKSLNEFYDIKYSASKERIDDFYFSLEQFLELVSHCLIWGRYNILDSPEIPLEFDIQIYIKAFDYIKEILPRHLSNESRNQITDYINYIIEKLPLYSIMDH